MASLAAAGQSNPNTFHIATGYKDRKDLIPSCAYTTASLRAPELQNRDVPASLTSDKIHPGHKWIQNLTDRQPMLFATPPFAPVLELFHPGHARCNRIPHIFAI